MEELIEKAAKALNAHPEFNEIILCDGANTVRLVRFTPAPYSPIGYQWGYNPFHLSPQP